jgi:hypothetical protein
MNEITKRPDGGTYLTTLNKGRFVDWCVNERGKFIKLPKELADKLIEKHSEFRSDMEYKCKINDR